MAEPASEVLDNVALNRSLLQRQMLAQRVDVTPLHALEHLVGMQAQIPSSPYVGLWSRLTDFHAEDVSNLIESRAAVRIALMRSTVHLVTAHDCLALRPVVQPVLDRELYQGSPWGREINGMNMEDLVEAARHILDESPLTMSELGTRLQERWPERNAGAMAYAIRNLVPLVQVPPRGLWRRSGKPRCTPAETWLGVQSNDDFSLDECIVRYLAAFGPSSAADVRAWSGLSGLSEAIMRLRPRLRAYRNEAGTELLDVIDAPFPDAQTPVSPRFLPEYDNVLLAHARRDRIIRQKHAAVVTHALGRPTFLVDGFVHGWWKIGQRGRNATLTIEPIEALTPQQQSDLVDEGTRLLTFVAGDVESTEILVAQPVQSD